MRISLEGGLWKTLLFFFRLCRKNQKVKTYQLTAAGKKQLAAERSNRERLTATTISEKSATAA